MQDKFWTVISGIAGLIYIIVTVSEKMTFAKFNFKSFLWSFLGAVILLVFLGSLYLNYTQNYPQTWTVTEGSAEDRNWTATFTVPGPAQEFTCVYTNPKYNPVKAKCIVADSGSYVSMKRFDTQDKNNCLYWGARAGKTISGFYYTSVYGGPHEWTVKIE